MTDAEAEIYYANAIAQSPHDWAPRLEYADWCCTQSSRDMPRAEVGRFWQNLHSVVNGCWGDNTLHARIQEFRFRCSRQHSVWRPPGSPPFMTFALIPPGSFVMGSPETEPGHRHDEAQVAVTLTHGFWLGVYTVKRWQWSRFMGFNPANTGAAPATRVSWNAALKFLDKLNEEYPIPGWRYDLPTEAQWEYACRAGTNTAYACGEQIDSAHANYADRLSIESSACVNRRPNAFGLYDMHGNVWEWCRDNYTSELPGGVDPYTRCWDYAIRVLRGGSYSCDETYIRSATRLGVMAHCDVPDIGFRVAIVVDKGKCHVRA